MALRDKAIALSLSLNAIVTGLEQYRGSNYPGQLAAFLKPLVEEYDAAVYVMRSREQAAAAIDALAECMDSVSAAATKGGMELFDESVLEQYWDLHTIFREATFRDQSL
ncbi:MAG: hypothetical protein PVH25_13885 [Burkholderiales bacterium]|jgi:hypothetical protein